jgi:hypothetical protein
MQHGRNTAVRFPFSRGRRYWPIWIWADLSLIYLKGFSPLRTNRDRARKRKPGNWRRADRKYHFARKKHFKAAIDGRLFRGNTVSLSGRKAASVGGLVASGSQCDRRKAPTSVEYIVLRIAHFLELTRLGTGPKNAFVNRRAQVIAGGRIRVRKRQWAQLERFFSLN